MRKNRFIRILSCVIVIVVYISWKYWDLISILSFPIVPLFSQNIRNMSIVAVLFFEVITAIIKNLLRNKVIIRMDSKCKENEVLLKYFFGESMIDFLFSCIYLLYALNLFVSYTHGIYPSGYGVLVLSVMYIIKCFLEKEYINFAIWYRENCLM